MRKLFVFVLLLLVVASAIAQTPDPKKIPHYFGPYPNWANSPFTTVDANITFGANNSCGGTGAAGVASVDVNGAITKITMISQGTGYTCAPDISIQSNNGTGAQAHTVFAQSSGYLSSIELVNGGSNYFDPIVTITGTGTGATAEATTDPYSGAITSINLTSAGSGYTSATVQITDAGGTGTGAAATATVASGVISVVIDNPGTGYRTPGGIRKFVDSLPGLGPGSANKLGQYISLAHPDTTTYPGADYYEIALVEYSKKLHSDLPPTKIRGYVQLNKGTDANGNNTINPDPPQYLGATIVARKNRPVRILFRNMLPTGASGNLFLPVDTTLMGSGPGPDISMMMPSDQSSVYDEVRNPVCGQPGVKPDGCYSENRATLHLHGGTTPWISDGTPHQWTVPANESTRYPKGVSASYVPDMWFDVTGAAIPQCSGQNTCAVQGATNNPGDGALTFYYTNQQSARLLFYHDHAWGITRLNVYAGEAAGYLITDDTDQALMAAGGPLDKNDPALGLGIPLVIQDRTFVPTQAQIDVQDPTWDAARWGDMGNFWFHHVYMPAQNPADPTGASPYGRWMYGPWFWPPANAATTPYQPIPNPYYDPSCDPATAPNGFCEPPQIPGTPNISTGMEQFNDTPMVNGTVYPTVTLEPKAYRFRILNAANDRFFNLQWYVADASGTEVALKAEELAAAQNDPNVFPTPDTNLSPAGPNWLQIGSEGGFLPTPVIVPNQPITWITDPTRFDYGNVDQHSMLVAPAERADVIVDFSKYAGKTLILYNDAPAAFPARQASYDYYTGDPDNSDIGGAPSTVQGFGPNTRTVMQVKVASSVSAPSLFNLSKLVQAFAHNASGTGVFESGQHPVIVGQAGYNRAYGTSFTTAGDCSKATSTSTTKCDGFARINQQGGDLFTFDTLSGQKLSIPLQPKAIHDEMNASSFDEYGRMTANIGIEAVPATPAAQTVTLYPFVNPPTEMIDASKLPSTITVTPISVADDGTQIWKITHNGVDTHPIHFHLFDVQLINRVTWDNIIIPPDLSELGWKDTIRTSPLEDTYVAVRPIIPTLPFPLPNSIRPLNPMMPLGATVGFNSIAPDGQATTSAITNDLVNFGWEYVWHCHILTHEEMDMMRPVAVAIPASAPTNLVATLNASGVVLTWTDTSRTATGYVVERAADSGFKTNLVRFTASDTTYTDVPPGDATSLYYRVVATNAVGTTKETGFTMSPGGNSFQSITVDSAPSNTVELSPRMSVTPQSLSFGTQTVNTSSAAQNVTVMNEGAGTLTISSVFSGTDVSSFQSTNGCSSLAPGQSCTISITLLPTSTGAKAATITVSSAAGTVPVTLSGTGTAIKLAPTTLSFSNQLVGTSSATKSVLITNVDPVNSITLTSISTTGANATDFTRTTNCGATLAASASCTVNIAFAPTAAGQRTAALSVSSSDPGVPQVALTGSAIAKAAIVTPTPGPLTSTSVTFTWTRDPAISMVYLQVGTTVGGTNVASIAKATGTSATVTVPGTGKPLFVRLLSQIGNGALAYTDYVYLSPNIAATISSPTPGSVLPGSSATFTWNLPAGVSTTYLNIGTTLGGSNLLSFGGGTATTVTATNLPVNGSTIYVRLISQISGTLVSNDYTYTAATVKAALSSPTPGSTLTGSSATFTWNRPAGVTTTYLNIGTSVGGSNLLSFGGGSATTVNATNLPTDGSTIYVRLYSQVNGTSLYTDYTFTAATIKAALTSPTQSVITGPSVQFTWTTDPTITTTYLNIGTTPGGSNLLAFGGGSATSVTANNLPTGGATIYVRLYTQKTNGKLLYTDYTFTVQ